MTANGAPKSKEEDLATLRESLLEQVRTVREEMGRLLDGMDYCLDWKPDEGEWSAREVLYHLVDTPPGGLHTAAGAILRDEIKELTIVADLTNITPQRQTTDLPRVQEEIEAVLAGLAEVVSTATDVELEEKAVPVHFPSRNAADERSVGRLIERSLDYHWRDHLGQLAALREALGLS